MSYWYVFLLVSQNLGIPSGLLESMCYVESNHRPNVIKYRDGNHEDSLGICQVKLSTAQHMGFKGTRKELLDPRNNIEWAGKYLHYQYKKYGTWSRAVIAYNKGSVSPGGRTNKYLRKVLRIWASMGDNACLSSNLNLNYSTQN